MVSTIWNVICSPALELNNKGYWEVTDVKEDKEIYSGYAKRFCESFHTQVRDVFDYETLNNITHCD